MGGYKHRVPEVISTLGSQPLVILVRAVNDRLPVLFLPGLPLPH